MSAYTHFHPSHFIPARKDRRGAAFAAPYTTDRSGERSIPGPQLRFLNPGACRYANPYSKTFWPDLERRLSPISHQAASCPKSRFYRAQLEPYLLRRVTMAARSWDIKSADEPNGLLRLVLNDVRLSHVYGSGGETAPDIVVDHMHIWVSPAWFNAVIPPYGAPLTVTGVLYEYISSQTRNIGILPILLEPQRPPKGPKLPARQARRVKRPDRDCPGASM